MTRRRSFLFACGALAVGAMRHTAAQARVYRVASLSISTRDSPQFVALLRRFRELGHVEGKNFALDARFLKGDWLEAPKIAAQLAAARPDVAMAFGSELIVRACRQAIGPTPLVMIAVDFDPVEKNYIASLSRPGGNITGVYFRQIESAVKRLELLREALPHVRRVAALFDLSTRDQLEAVAQAAAKLGISLLPQQLSSAPYDFDAALQAAAAAKAQAVMALSSGAFFGPRQRWIATARELRLPVIANPNYAEAGALIAFGASFPHMYARAAEYADRILKGAKPSEMPVEQPSQYELVVNQKTARALDINLTPAVLLRATRVIE